jgi:bifunctional DNA-binding transcriptional regulator/antitoxin component of YhaV-PrlF toxin-antitoxin module
MTLLRALSKIDKEGKVKVPANVQRAAGLKKGQLVELKITGASRNKRILIVPMGMAKMDRLFSYKKEF